jgi:hypothetical protein
MCSSARGCIKERLVSARKTARPKTKVTARISQRVSSSLVCATEINDNELGLLRRIDELYTTWPFLGSRRMTAMLQWRRTRRPALCPAQAT